MAKLPKSKFRLYIRSEARGERLVTSYGYTVEEAYKAYCDRTYRPGELLRHTEIPPMARSRSHKRYKSERTLANDYRLNEFVKQFLEKMSKNQ